MAMAMQMGFQARQPVRLGQEMGRLHAVVALQPGQLAGELTEPSVDQP